MRCTIARLAGKRGSMYLGEVNTEGGSIKEIHAAVRRGVKMAGLVRHYLKRITLYDHRVKAIATKWVVYKAVKHGIRMDDEYRSLSPYEEDDFLEKEKPLFGVFLCLKDNMMTQNMATRAGCMAMKHTMAIKWADCEVVKRLKDAGAVPLLKGNMHELSLAGTTLSSSIGQTKNPYDLTRTPGGSSGGVAASVALSFAQAGIATDTMNSIRSPASACNLVGFRPTHGLIPMKGIVPVAPSQDVVGPIGRYVYDCRRIFNVLADKLEEDKNHEPLPDLSDYRIGILTTYGPEDKGVQQVFDTALARLTAKGAQMEQFSMPEWDIEKIQKLDVQKYEFAKAFEDFMKENVNERDSIEPPMTLKDIAERKGMFSDEAVKNTAFWPAMEEYPEEEYQEALSKLKAFRKSVNAEMEKRGFDAILYPHQRILTVKIGEPEQKGRNGLLASLSGNPAICIPGGFTEPEHLAAIGVPVGIEFMGRRNQDHMLLDLAEMVEQALGRQPNNWRQPPSMRLLETRVREPPPREPVRKSPEELESKIMMGRARKQAKREWEAEMKEKEARGERMPAASWDQKSSERKKENKNKPSEWKKEPKNRIRPQEEEGEEWDSNEEHEMPRYEWSEDTDEDAIAHNRRQQEKTWRKFQRDLEEQESSSDSENWNRRQKGSSIPKGSGRRQPREFQDEFGEKQSLQQQWRNKNNSWRR